MNFNPMEVAKLHPDYLGFIFWKPSARAFTGEMMNIPPEIKKVGVFVDTPIEEVVETTRTYCLHAVQLHGQESADYCRALRTQFQFKDMQHCNSQAGAEGLHRPTGIIKAFRIGEDFDFEVLRSYEAVCDHYLFDSRGELPGGNGYGFDWSLLSAYPSSKPFFLSGGIGPGDAMKVRAFFSHPSSRYCMGIDVNSRFEISPGNKDVRELRKFLKVLRQKSIN